MNKQHQILQTLRLHKPAVVAAVEADGAKNRCHLARTLCQRYGFVDPRGQLQLSGCLKALRTLEAEGWFTLPARQGPALRLREIRRLGEPVPEPSGAPARADQVQDLTLVLVTTEDHFRLWNELMIREHPLGRQLRYLIHSAHGWLGAVGFGAGALALHDRDAWIGWDRAGRAAHLDKVVGLSRLLIRPSVNCANLASTVLAQAVRAAPADFAARYGYHPWLLETFVAAGEPGACYQAANWLRVGQTRGRGRQDRTGRGPRAPKDIYLYVLDSRFRQYLGAPAPSSESALEPQQGLDQDVWAAQEFGGTVLGDRRLQARLITIAARKGRRPGAAIPAVFQGDRAGSQGYYRFIDAAEDNSLITFEAILAPHRDRTVQRIRAQPTVLIIHDTTSLNFDTLECCADLGRIGANQTTSKTRGLRLHSSLAVDAVDGVPLGLLHAKCWAPQPTPEGLLFMNEPPIT